MAAHKRQGKQFAWYTSELVVVLQHRTEVLRTLDHWNVVFERPTNGNKNLYENQELGLALLPLSDDVEAADKAVAGLIREATEDAEVAHQLEKAPRNAGAAGTVEAMVNTHLESLEPGMDRLLWALRTRFAAKYAGWTPTLGKNRLGGDVEGGNGHISHTSVMSPERSQWQPTEPIRPTEPGSGVRVGVLDTSVFSHPWLAGGLAGPGEDFLASRSDYPAAAGHGTFVAGLVLQQAPGCAIEFRKVLSDDDGTATSWDVAKTIVEVGRRGLDVLNLSLGSYTEDGQPPLLLATAIDRLDPQILVVAAAGNHGDPAIPREEQRKPAWPAALDGVVAVGSASADGVRSWFSPPEVPWIDVFAQGENVQSTFLTGRVADPDGSSTATEFDGYARWNGSSFAAALVSGAIAARTVPGHRSARDAWRTLVDEGPELREEWRAKLEERDIRPDVEDRFLPLVDESWGSAPGRRTS